jgi:hypothetical protein
MSKPKNAVLIVTAPAEWHPTHWHDVPPSIIASKFYARGLPLHTCIEIARAFNRHHSGQRFAHEWAMVSVSLRRNPFKHKANFRKAVDYQNGAVVYEGGDPDETTDSGAHDVGALTVDNQGGVA